MNSDVNELARAVLKRPLDECSFEELQQIAEQYPYFGPVQLLLAKKTSATSPGQEDNSSSYEEQVQKTSLYFQNRVWLNYLLNESSTNSSVTSPSIITEKEIPVAEDMETDQPGTFIVGKNVEAETPIIQEPVKEEITEQTEVAVEMTQLNDVRPEQVAVVVSNNEEQSNPISDKEEPILQTNPPFEMSSLKFEPAPAKSGLLFEPYHTVDYFASQGIKFREEEKPKDRFGIQLKSFTEWLKTLKQGPATENATIADSSAEKKVEQMAEYSIAERHVITEAMAEVWKKQGNRAKAEEIYRKLSLLDPSKSSYFAAKIEELKKPS